MNTATPFIPRRHGIDVEYGRRTARALRRFIRGNPEPSEARWRAIGEGLMQGDPLADELLVQMQAQGMPKAMKDFQACLQHGIGSMKCADPALRAFFETVEQSPPWLDREKLAEGARVFQSMGMTSHFILRNVSLMGGYQASAFNKTLILTGALNAGASRRVAETLKWVVSATGTGAMDIGAEGYRDTLHVRLIHAMIRRRVAALPDWDAAEMGLPINQTDMAATWLAFSALLLMGVRVMGMPITRDEAHAVMHLWKYICWLMGVDQSWLTDDEMQGRHLLYQMLIAQTPPDHTSVQLGSALMNEALALPYPGMRTLRARYESARHLSVTRLFTGREGMKALGLPPNTLPWYPIASAPFRFAWHLAHRVIPGGAARARRVGRKTHEQLVRLHFSGRTGSVRPLNEV